MAGFGDSLQQAGAVVGAAAPVVGAALGVAGGVAKLFGGKSDYEKNKEELAKIKDPFYRIQDEYFQNRNTSANEAQYGFNPTEQNYYTTESQRGLGSSLNAETSTGGSPNSIVDVFDAYNRGISRTAAEGAQLRQQKLMNFYERNKDLAGQKTIQWHLNEYQPTQNKRALLSGNMVAAKQNQTQGWNDILGSLSAAGTASINQQLLDAYKAKGAPVTNNVVNNTGGNTSMPAWYYDSPQAPPQPSPNQIDYSTVG